MSLEQGFLQAILDRPNDDTPRSLYADWLEEHGGPAAAARAELIRTQLDLARLPLDDERRPHLAARERAVLGRYAVGWRRGLPHLDGIQWGHFVRGFIGSVWTELATVHLHSAALFQAQPIDSLWLGRIDYNSFPILCQSPWLGRIQALSVREGTSGLANIGALAQSPHAVGLRTLYLLELGAEAARSVVAFLRAPQLTAFHDLHVCYSTWGDREIATLATCESLTRLTSLDLSCNALRDGSVRALAESPYVSNLQYLNLSTNRLSRDGARAVAESPHLRRLVYLDIGNNHLDTDTLERLRQRFHRVRA